MSESPPNRIVARVASAIGPLPAATSGLACGKGVQDQGDEVGEQDWGLIRYQGDKVGVHDWGLIRSGDGVFGQVREHGEDRSVPRGYV